MIAIGSDHGGFDLKEEIRGYLEENGIAYKDFGCFSPESIDYADVAYPVAKAVAAGEYEKGILLLRHRDRHFHCGQQGKGNPGSLLLRLFQRKADQAAQ